MTAGGHSGLPRLGVSLGDPRGIGPEIVAAALADCVDRGVAEFRVAGADGAVGVDPGTFESRASLGFEAVGTLSEGGDEESEVRAGTLAGLAIDRVCQWALAGEVDGIVTAPISKAALSEAGYDFPGHTEFLQDRTGAPEVTMIMSAESTPLGGCLRVALATVHVPLREVPALLTTSLVVRKTVIAVEALRDWWGITTPRLALAGLNPHASEGGLFGDEEARILSPAADKIESETGAEVVGIFPGDTVFRLCLEGRVDLVVVPYHDVGLAVVKTLARESGVNVTAGLPFPRTSPDHGTAFDIAGRGLANPASMTAAIDLCGRFCRTRHARS